MSAGSAVVLTLGSSRTANTGLHDADAFWSSAKSVAQVLKQRLGAPTGHLDLFDIPLAPEKFSSTIEEHFERLTPDSFDSVIVLYVGHGQIAEDRYYLTGRATGDELVQTSLRFDHLTKCVRKSAPGKPLYFILDSCFSGHGGIELSESLPTGPDRALFASSSAVHASRYVETSRLTIFSEVLLAELGRDELTDMAGVIEVVVSRIREAGGPTPVVSSNSDHNSSPWARLKLRQTSDPRFSSPPPEPITWDVGGRGELTDFVVDGSFTFTSDGLEARNALRQHFQSASTRYRVPTGLLYSVPECAARWLHLASHHQYGYQTLRDAVWQFVPRVITTIQEDNEESFGGVVPVDLVSLGSGDGAVDLKLLEMLARSERIRVQYYYFLDTSFELLQVCAKNLRKARNESLLDKEFRVKGVFCDFRKLDKVNRVYTFDRSVNLFGLTGLTLGNFPENTLLQGVRQGMDTGDYLLLDARLHTAGEDKVTLKSASMKVHRERYAHERNERFAFGPLEALLHVSRKDVDIDYELTRDQTAVENAWNIETVARGLRSAAGFSADEATCAVTTVYDYTSLSRWLSARGWDVRASTVIEDIGLFLLRRT